MRSPSRAVRGWGRLRQGDATYSIHYCSRNLIPVETLLPELRALLLGARTHNAARQITGLLLFSSDCFIQRLEGPIAALQELFAKIQRDPRHCDVTVLDRGPAERRAYAGWSMAFTVGEAIDSLAGIETSHKFDPDDPVSSAVLLRHRQAHGPASRVR